ncbi:trichohyalin-like isoform X2 [Frankliniella occidentalis]|uniref:Trichohyalin-like isoform X2 n=1 Tax=Frankliniella occidentalis TaxID=133901 RepID=A0A9C6X482_FRAOC|nr:trichohyalin-like isoform X2 [Frankliniella occidentalis]
MDDLDRELFSSSLKKLNPSSLKISKSELDFDEEDPLRDLLSSSGENTPVKSLPKKLSGKEPITDLSKHDSKSKRIADIFGIDEQEAHSPRSAATPPRSVIKNEDPGDWLGLKAESDVIDKKIESHTSKYENFALSKVPNSRPLTKRNSQEDNILVSQETKDVPKTIDVSKKTTGFAAADDFLTRNIPARKSVNETKKSSSILSTFISDFDSKPNPQIESFTNKGFEKDSAKNSYTPSASREPRRSTQRRGGDLVDPLGLFSSSRGEPSEPTISSDTGPAKKEDESQLRKSGISGQVLNSDPVPQWLESATVLAASSTQTPNAADNVHNSGHSLVIEEKQLPKSDADILAGLADLETLAGEAAAQQQKSLLSALALKRQEDNLLQLQAQQAALLAQHEQQLGALVQRQVQRQQQMIRQQEQIQAHIQALMVQPPAIAPITLPAALWSTADNFTGNNDSLFIMKTPKKEDENDQEIISELKGQVYRLERENQDMRTLLESEKQRYSDQLSDMEIFFRKQLDVQEDTMTKQEKRHLSEMEATRQETAIRITRLKDEHEEISKQQAQRMAKLHAEWLADLQRLGEFHQQAVEMLRSEQTSAVEHWKNLQAAELEAIKEAGCNARLLEKAVKNIEESSATILEIKLQMKREDQTQLLEKKESLMKQEMHLIGLKEALEKQTVALEAERACISTLSRDLESHVLRRQQEFNEEKKRFEDREKKWEKEKLGAIEHLKEEKQLLEKLQLEAHMELSELGERKLALAADVARLETRLNIQSTHANRNSQQAEQNAFASQMVAEARSTLEAAQEAGKDVQKEREEVMALKISYNAEHMHLQTLRQELQIREQTVNEELARAKAYREEGTSALNEARRLERERSEHATDLAQRLLHLKEREDRLAEEKLAVTMEWKRIQDSRDNFYCLRCEQMPGTPLSSFKHKENIVDPLPIIMKLEAEQGLDFITLGQPKYHSSLLDSVSQ